jgi:hypothetical protein
MGGESDDKRWAAAVPGVDELKVCDWFRLAQMDETRWLMRVGDQSFNIEVPKDPRMPVLLHHAVLGDIGVCVARKERDRGR